MAYDFICKSAQVEPERRIMDAGCRAMDEGRGTTEAAKRQLDI